MCPKRPRSHAEPNRVAQSHVQALAHLRLLALTRGQWHTRPRARPVRPGPTRSGAARTAREELLEDMLLVDGGARIEEKDHLYRRQSQTSAHSVRDGLSSSCRGQGKEERTCPKDRLAHAPPPPAALSSHVLDRHGEEACASAGITSNDSRWHRGRARSRTARPQGGCPNEFDSLCESAARSREPRVEYGQDAQQQRPRSPRHQQGTEKRFKAHTKPPSNSIWAQDAALV